MIHCLVGRSCFKLSLTFRTSDSALASCKSYYEILFGRRFLRNVFMCVQSNIPLRSSSPTFQLLTLMHPFWRGLLHDRRALWCSFSLAPDHPLLQCVQVWSGEVESVEDLQGLAQRCSLRRLPLCIQDLVDLVHTQLFCCGSNRNHFIEILSGHLVADVVG